MENVLRGLIFKDQVSFTLADTTDIVKQAKKLHILSQGSLLSLGKCLSAMVFMSACLKEKTGEISLSLQGNGTGGSIGVSGNQSLYLRGYIENTTAIGTEKEIIGDFGSLTIIRDDGYNRPFVGSCALSQTGEIDVSFEEYFRISEQLPTRMKTVVETNEDGECVFAGVVAIQPLPFADEKTLEKVENISLEEILKTLQSQGLKQTAEEYFSQDISAESYRKTVYRCNCSREYLKRVIITLGKAQAENIVKEDGEIKVHCHYCNSDYKFSEQDINELFN